MNFLKALALGLARALAIAAYALVAGAEWIYRYTPAGSTAYAEAAAEADDYAEDDEQRAYRAWVAENRRQAAENRAARDPEAAEQSRLERATIAHARARMGGQGGHPDEVHAFFEKHERESVDNDDHRPTLH